jgi:hypothetical protein
MDITVSLMNHADNRQAYQLLQTCAEEMVEPNLHAGETA